MRLLSAQRRSGTRRSNIDSRSYGARLNWLCTPENIHHHLKQGFRLIDSLNFASKRCKWPRLDAHRIAQSEYESGVLFAWHAL